MPNKLKDLSGEDIIKLLYKNGFILYSTKGSHSKLRKIIDGNTQNLIIPMHKSIAKGTLRDIYNQIREYLPESEIKDTFFTK